MVFLQRLVFKSVICFERFRYLKTGELHARDASLNEDRAVINDEITQSSYGNPFVIRDLHKDTH